LNLADAEASATTSLDVSASDELTQRRSHGSKYSTDPSSEASDIVSIGQAIETGKPLDEEQIQTFHRVLNTEITILNEELRGKCTTTDNVYPNNLTLYNFVEWTCLPTLVYDLEYPRQERVNWWYVAEKSAATLGVIWVMIIISQAYIYPVVVETVRLKDAGMSLDERWKEFPWVVSDMLFPMLLEQLLSWYVIWECLLNVLAEITRFADRGFYGAWWNSVSFDQYARDWNRPVHNFLLRHVYHSSISFFHLSKMPVECDCARGSDVLLVQKGSRISVHVSVDTAAACCIHEDENDAKPTYAGEHHLLVWSIYWTKCNY
jgi:sterol O-acyltransferase